MTGLSQYYLTEHLAPIVLQRFIAILEAFVFDLLRILLHCSPGKLGSKNLTLGELLSKGTIAAVVDEAIDEKLNSMRYAKPKDWFEYITSIERLGCPSSDEIECIAEMKATRDVVEHNSGIVNRTYLGKSGGKARFKEGENVEVTDTYLLDCWTLVRKVCDDMAAAGIKVLSAKK